MIVNLAPASYTLKASAADPAPAEVTGLLIGAGQEKTVDLILHPASLEEQITVSASALSAIDVSSAHIGANVNEREVATLPPTGANSRNCICSRRGPRPPAGARSTISASAAARTRKMRSATTASRALPSSMLHRAISTVKFPPASGFRRAWKTSRSSASSRVTIPPSSARERHDSSRW